MIENIKSLTTDFIENEKSVLLMELTPSIRISNEEGDCDGKSEIVETINTELINQSCSSVDLETSEISIYTKTDYSGISPKRYTTTCYIQPKTIPYWYSESILLYINSTRKVFEEKVFFKDKLMPFKWSETMSTEINFSNNYYSCMENQVPDIYISLENQKNKN